MSSSHQQTIVHAAKAKFMKLTSIVFTFLFAFGFNAYGQSPVTAPAPFPASTAKEEGVSSDALLRLDRLVQTLVEEKEVVGAELLVIKNGRTILHASHGWRDRESNSPMKNGTAFCVRSMTKCKHPRILRLPASRYLRPLLAFK